MKRILSLAAISLLVVFVSCAQQQSKNKDSKSNAGSAVIQMDNKMFIEKVFDYKTNGKTWKYNGNMPAIIDFYATWCGPCRTISPIMESLAQEYKGKIVVYKVDTDKEKELSQAMGIQSLPTIVFIPLKGKPEAIVGAADKSAFEEAVKDVLLKKQQ